MNSVSEHAELYNTLAEALAEPPEWMRLPGCEWPLFDLVAHLLPGSSVLPKLVAIPAESEPARQARYATLTKGQVGQPSYWLYENAFLTGSILGQATFDVAKYYSQAGLEVEGSELPDGAAPELAFLAYLALNDPAGEKDFLHQHAARWLPELGKALSLGSDPLYAVIGQILFEWINYAKAGFPAPAMPAVQLRRAGTGQLPVLRDAPACTLCGFCTQRCPSAALFIKETDQQTSLTLIPSRCNGCARCARVCDAGLISMQPAIQKANASVVVLRTSERVACHHCGQPMVSQAEMDFVIKQLGHHSWLDLCPDCRMPACAGTYTR